MMVSGAMTKGMEEVLMEMNTVIYDGEWRGGKMHGEGTFTPANEEPYKGIWHLSQLLRKM